MRTQQRYLGLLPSRPGPTAENVSPPECLTFSEGALDTLRRHLSVTGRLRGGPLYGERNGDNLHIVLVSSGGYPFWYDDFKQALFAPDERYMLGWNDCVTAVYDGKVDWIGNWLAYPSSALGDTRTDLAWLDLGYEQGLFDDRHFLLVVGRQETLLAARAYTIEQGEWVTVPTEL